MLQGQKPPHVISGVSFTSRDNHGSTTVVLFAWTASSVTVAAMWIQQGELEQPSREAIARDGTRRGLGGLGGGGVSMPVGTIQPSSLKPSELHQPGLCLLVCQRVGCFPYEQTFLSDICCLTLAAGALTMHF